MMGEISNAVVQHVSAHQTCHHQGDFEVVIVKQSNGPLYGKWLIISDQIALTLKLVPQINSSYYTWYVKY